MSYHVMFSAGPKCVTNGHELLIILADKNDDDVAIKNAFQFAMLSYPEGTH